jgi:hypothetical protein
MLIGELETELLVDLGPIDAICVFKQGSEAGHLAHEGGDLIAGEGAGGHGQALPDGPLVGRAVPPNGPSRFEQGCRLTSIWER